ncbi:MAG: DNA adenine methylase [Rhizobiales bacterium]|nr:DNA adenine methylase [Hyphomicrobiales bacterium]
MIIEHQLALKTMLRHDCENTLHFVDPPYLPETRTPSSAYVNDMGYSDHVELIDCIKSIKGMVILCGYNSDLYHENLELCGWKLIEKDVYTAQKKPRVECLWLNELAQSRLKGGVL